MDSIWYGYIFVIFIYVKLIDIITFFIINESNCTYIKMQTQIWKNSKN